MLLFELFDALIKTDIIVYHKCKLFRSALQFMRQLKHCGFELIDAYIRLRDVAMIRDVDHAFYLFWCVGHSHNGDFLLCAINSSSLCVSKNPVLCSKRTKRSSDYGPQIS